MPSTGHQSHARALTPRLKRGDQLPDLVIQVSSELGPVDVSDASRVRVLGQRHGQIVIDRDAQGSSDGVVTMPWELSDVGVGVIGFEVEVTWTGTSLAQDPPGSGLYAIPEGMTGSGGLYDPGALPGSAGLYRTSTSVAGAGRRRTFPAAGLVRVRIDQDVDGSDSALIEDPPESGLYRLIDAFTLTEPGLYTTGPLHESPAGSGLYGLDYTPGS